MKTRFLVCWIPLLLVCQLWAQTFPDLKKQPAGKEKSAGSPLEGVSGEVAVVPSCAPLTGATQAACEEALKENYRYQASAFRHRKDIFDWSLTADKLMFAV